MEAVRSELFGNPVPAGGKTEAGIGEIGRGGKKEGQQHRSGVSAAATPGPKQHDA